MRNSVRIGRISGIEVGAHWTWLIVFAYLTFSLATAYFPNTNVAPGYGDAVYWTAGAVGTILLFASVFAHEMAHSLTARSQGMDVDSITLFIFGGISNIQERPPSPRAEFMMTVVGPLTSLILGGLLLGMTAIIDTDQLILALLSYLGLINVIVGVFNLIPGFPLDGGRLLRAGIWAATDDRRRATRIAAAVGLGIAWLLILGGLAMAFLTGNVGGGIWLALIGWFLSQAAGYRFQHPTEQEGS